MVSPAHQFPTGQVMAPERAPRSSPGRAPGTPTSSEDDYDAENRYDRQPIGALQGLDPDPVVHAGTVSKAWRLACRIGWLSVPAEFVGELAHIKDLADSGSPTLTTSTRSAHLIERGDYERPHARARREVPGSP